MIFFDTETCGLHGPIVLLQWAEGDGPIHLHSVWHEPVEDTLELIEKITTDPDGVVGFNLSFDWFHICQLYTVLSLFVDRSCCPVDYIDQYAELEPLGRDGPCLKPTSACDLMLHARRGPYQSTMDRGDIRIKKIPTTLAWQLAQELERRIPLKDIFFARKKDKYASKWQVFDIEDDDGEIDKNFKDIVLKFAPSSALKALAIDALQIPAEDVLVHSDIELSRSAYPEEVGYAPFAKAIGSKANWNNAWPDKIRFHITHWGFNNLARKYANDDVDYTRRLFRHFGSPPLGDDDSILACMVGAVRWRGFSVDMPGLRKLREETSKRGIKTVNGHTFHVPTSPVPARYYVTELMGESEKVILEDSTKKVLLQEISKWAHCSKCGKSVSPKPAEPCDCHAEPIFHPAAARAAEVLDARQRDYELNLYDKFLRAGRFHASFVVIGTLSSRMSGGDDLNAQGIKKQENVRNKFPLAFEPEILCGGDFAGFEVTLAEACYKDPDLRKDLQTGKKIHALFGQYVYPGLSYDDIVATDGTANDLYTKCKQAVFAMFYGGEGFTLKDRLGVDLETADKAYALFCKRYPKVGEARREVFDMFCSMRQPGGIGSKVEWHEPSDYIESMFGFRRYFTLENMICKALYVLANKPPKSWLAEKIKVQRRDRLQTASGAIQSALFAAAFALQAANMRAAANHVIQSSGAQITKYLQRKIWDLQPCGVSNWIVRPMNIHDEVMVPASRSITAELEQVVRGVVEHFKPAVPLLKMDWVTGLSTWADKG